MASVTMRKKSKINEHDIPFWMMQWLACPESARCSSFIWSSFLHSPPHHLPQCPVKIWKKFFPIARYKLWGEQLCPCWTAKTSKGTRETQLEQRAVNVSLSKLRQAWNETLWAWESKGRSVTQKLSLILSRRLQGEGIDLSLLGVSTDLTRFNS